MWIVNLWYVFHRIVYKENLPFYHTDDDVWSPNMQTVFKALASARLCAAVWNNINDCDETYNYWEPVSTCDSKQVLDKFASD